MAFSTIIATVLIEECTTLRSRYRGVTSNNIVSQTTPILGKYVCVMIDKKSIQLHISQTDTRVHVNPLQQCNVGKNVIKITFLNKT